MKIFKQNLFLLDNQAKKAIPFLIFSFIISSVLDVVGIGLIGLFLGILANPNFALHKFPHMLFLLQGMTAKKLIIISGIFITAIFSIKAVIALLIQRNIVSFCLSLCVRLKARLMSAYQSAPHIYHMQKNSAYLITRIQDNINSYINNVLMPMLNIVSNGIVTLFIMIFLGFLHPFLTTFLVSMFLLVGLGYDFLAKKQLIAIGKTGALANGEITKNVYHALGGLNEIRVLGRESYFLKKLNESSHQYAHAYGVLVALQQTPRYLIENIMAIFIVGLGLVGVIAGFNIDSIVAIAGMFAAAGARLLPTINQIIVGVNQLRGYHYHMELVCEELLEVSKLTEKKPLTDRKGKIQFSEINLKNATYQYPNTNHPVFTDINMTILKGQSIGLVGPSGAGKSTLINVLLGFLDLQKGQLLIDGKEVRDAREWLNNFAYIPQSIFLLDDTLQRNVALGVEDEDIDTAKLWHAIKMAQLTDVIQQLAKGLDTIIGENGMRLSGGQRQRVALARAFYHERDIIIMDEATSSLDNETEAEVINTIKRLKGSKTLIVIAHRLTTVEHCDLLYKVEKRCVTAGSFKEIVGVLS